MNELRTALIILGAVFLAALLLWERRRSARRSKPAPAPEAVQTATTATLVQSRPKRLEPSIGDFSPGDAELPESLDVPTIHPVEPVRVEVAREVAVDIPGAAVLADAPRNDPPADPHADSAPAPVALPAAPVIRWPPPRTDRVLTLRVVRGDGQPLAGRALRLAIESAGMVHGPQRIFHLVDADGVVRASAANLMRPGSLDPALMDAQEFRGLSLFSILPGPVPAERMLDGLVELAQAVAGRVGAVVQDEQGAIMAGERLAQLKRSLTAHPQGGAPA